MIRNKDNITCIKCGSRRLIQGVWGDYFPIYEPVPEEDRGDEIELVHHGCFRVIGSENDFDYKCRECGYKWNLPSREEE